MQDDLRDLYQEVILDHSKKPRNFHALPEATHHAEGFNPLCGDRLTVYLKVDNNTIQDVSFEGSGCAISKSSASMMTSSVKGKTVEEIQTMFEKFHEMLSRDVCRQYDATALGKLAVFSGVCEFPARVKCATLAWHTLRSALEGKSSPATTE